jgi:hypothetical protein
MGILDGRALATIPGRPQVETPQGSHAPKDKMANVHGGSRPPTRGPVKSLKDFPDKRASVKRREGEKMKCYLSLGLLTLAAIWSANPSVADEQLTTRDNPPSTPQDEVIVKPTPEGNLFASGQYNVENFSVGTEAYVSPNGENGDRVDMTNGNLFASGRYNGKNFSVGGRVYMNPSSGERGAGVKMTVPIR